MSMTRADGRGQWRTKREQKERWSYRARGQIWSSTKPSPWTNRNGGGLCWSWTEIFADTAYAPTEHGFSRNLKMSQLICCPSRTLRSHSLCTVGRGGAGGDEEGGWKLTSAPSTPPHPFPAQLTHWDEKRRKKKKSQTTWGSFPECPGTEKDMLQNHCYGTVLDHNGLQCSLVRMAWGWRRNSRRGWEGGGGVKPGGASWTTRTN